LAVDIPSGLDANSGQPRGAAVVATATATFVGLKVGMLQASAQPYTGAVHVVDIGVPRELAQAMALDI
jgi:NAD(P)H-hydrate epimerase